MSEVRIIKGERILENYQKLKSISFSSRKRKKAKEEVLPRPKDSYLELNIYNLARTTVLCRRIRHLDTGT